MDDGDGQVKQFLADYHLDEEAFKEQVSYSLYLDEYLQQEISVNVSEDDITEMYAQIKEQSEDAPDLDEIKGDRKSTRLNSSHVAISYAVFCLKKKKKQN